MSLKFTIGKAQAKQIQALQKKIDNIRRERGFTRDPERVLLLLVEEVGELAQQLKRSWSPNYGELQHEAMADEVADILFVTLGLATTLGIDASNALANKIEKDSKRIWLSKDKPIQAKHDK